MTYDHNYPPQYAPQPPKRGMSTGKKVALFGCLPATLLALLVAGGCAAMGGAVLNEVDKSVKADASEDARATKEDVKITGCTLKDDEFLGRDVDARVKITNHGKKRANYLVEGEFLDSKGNKIGELLATVNNLAPGASTSQGFDGLFTSDDLKGVTKGSCSIVNVSRDEWTAAN